MTHDGTSLQEGNHESTNAGTNQNRYRALPSYHPRWIRHVGGRRYEVGSVSEPETPRPVDLGAGTCTCRGYAHRGHCVHLREAEEYEETHMCHTCHVRPIVTYAHTKGDVGYCGNCGREAGTKVARDARASKGVTQMTRVVYATPEEKMLALQAAFGD